MDYKIVYPEDDQAMSDSEQRLSLKERVKLAHNTKLSKSDLVFAIWSSNRSYKFRRIPKFALALFGVVQPHSEGEIKKR